MIKSKGAKILVAPLALAYSVMWAGGIGSHLLHGGPPAHMWWAATVFLALAGLILLATSNADEIRALVAAAAIGVASEVAGVRYGFLYGEYAYTDALRPLVFGVPLVMASAWMVLAAYVRQVVSFFRLPAWAEITAASLWMTAIDLVIDPLAAGRLGYWRWHEGGRYYGIPARNFLGWFIVSLLIFSLIGALEGGRRRANPWARLTGLSIVVFFTTIALIHGLMLAFSAGAALCLLDLAAARLPARIKAIRVSSR
jgi:putative membrane protein